MSRLARWVLVNALGTLLLLWLLNLVAASLYDARFWFQRVLPPAAKSEALSLEGEPRAGQIFREFDRLETRYVPYVAWSRAPFEGETIHVGPDGDRRVPHVPDRPTRHVRFLGGSTIWGKGVSDENTIPALFAERHPDWAVYNHGESGFVSRQELARLVNLLNQDEPVDAVVFYDGCNDLYTLCRPGFSINGHSREVKIRERMTPPSFVFDALTGAIREVIGYGLLQLDASGDETSSCADDPEHAERVARTLVNNWGLARVLAESRGVELHAILQPIAPMGNARVDYLGLEGKADSPRHRSIRAVYPRVQRIIRESGEPWMHDFSDAFDRDEPIYIDGCHVNALGNRLIAQRIDALLDPTKLSAARAGRDRR